MPRPHPIDHRGLILLLGAGLALAALLAKGLEFIVFGGQRFGFDPWSLAALFLALWLFDGRPSRRRLALVGALAMALVLPVAMPKTGIHLLPMALGGGALVVLLGGLLFSRRRGDDLFTLSLGLMLPFAHQVCLVSQRLTTLQAETLDGRAYLTDLALGFDAAGFFRAAGVLDHMPVRVGVLLVYAAITFAMAAVILVKYRRGDRGWMVAALAMVMAGVFGSLLYHVIPLAGPAHAYAGGLPGADLAAWGPLAVDQALVRNAMPSLHTAWAVLILLNCRGFGRLWQGAAALFLAITLLATLATGEHYLIDLVVGAGFALACQALAVLLLDRRPEAALPALLCILAVAFWFVAMRIGEPWLVTVPGLALTAALLTIGGAIVAALRLAFPGSAAPVGLPVTEAAPAGE